MRLVFALLALSSCAPAAPLAVAPAAATVAAPAASAKQDPEPLQPPATCTIKRTWHEKQGEVARCQMMADEITSEVEARVGATGIDVVRDREASSGVNADASLEGRRYAHVPAATDDEARRVQALAAADSLTGRARPEGQESPELVDSVSAMIDARPHGVRASDVKVRVLSMGTRGDSLVFGVKAHATESDAGMCHRWTNEVFLAGELLLRTSDGTLASMRLSGPTSGTEALCPEGAKQSGRSAEPRVCTRGETTIDVTRSCP